MRTLALLATLTFVALAFAGCAGDGNGGGDSSSSSSSSSRSSTSGTGTTSRSSTASATGSASATSTGGGTTATNQPPVGTISVTVDGANATFSLSGSDPDGDTLVWDLTYGDGSKTNGTTLPANPVHTYASAGNFTANFTITDGQAPATYDVTVTLAGVGGGAGPQVVEGEWTTGIPACGPANPAQSLDYSGATPLEGVAWVVFDVDPATYGKPFTATFANSPAYFADEVDFYLEDGTFLDYFPETGDSVVTGEVPATASFGALYACDPAPGSVSYTAG
ncbi:MAG: hypothetical protein QOJ26_1855 [Thermoplasmata archaeon]|jgi:hypothetical protein|nr:hypothetical protein [Thermoplasmata archaeon]MEA3166971.1 hypothetical protein [Thermoplasmata archaeon]